MTDWHTAMRQFFAEVDAAVAQQAASTGAACTACGTCCKFDVAEHTLFASELERRWLLTTAPAPAEPAPGSLEAQGLRCPWQTDNRCTAREGRVLGCRLYYCTWPAGTVEDDLYAQWHNRLRCLHDALGVDWAYRPLLPLEPEFFVTNA